MMPLFCSVAVKSTIIPEFTVTESDADKIAITGFMQVLGFIQEPPNVWHDV